MEIIGKSSCSYCKKTFHGRSSLARHYLKVHGLKITGKIQCDLCHESFHSVTFLRNHHIARHNFINDENVLQFSSLQEFSNWKEVEEKRSIAKFCRNTTSYTSRNGDKKWHYYCNRTGYYRYEGTGQRRLKSQGSCKLNGVCLASMEVTEKLNGNVSVTYYSRHYGHTLDVAHLIPKKRKAEIAEILAKQIQNSSDVNVTTEIQTLSPTIEPTMKEKASSQEKIISMVESLLHLIKTKELDEATYTTFEAHLSTLFEMVQGRKKSAYTTGERNDLVKRTAFLT